MEACELKEKIANRLKDLRKEKGIGQIQLADELNIDKSTIAKYETAVSAPSAQMLVILAKYFEVSVDYLLGLVDY